MVWAWKALSEPGSTCITNSAWKGSVELFNTCSSAVALKFFSTKVVLADYHLLVTETILVTDCMFKIIPFLYAKLPEVLGVEGICC